MSDQGCKDLKAIAISQLLSDIWAMRRCVSVHKNPLPPLLALKARLMAALVEQQRIECAMESELPSPSF